MLIKSKLGQKFSFFLFEMHRSTLYNVFLRLAVHRLAVPYLVFQDGWMDGSMDGVHKKKFYISDC